jgi:hypothetical protein
MLLTPLLFQQVMLQNPLRLTECVNVTQANNVDK